MVVAGEETAVPEGSGTAGFGVFGTRLGGAADADGTATWLLSASTVEPLALVTSRCACVRTDTTMEVVEVAASSPPQRGLADETITGDVDHIRPPTIVPCRHGRGMMVW